MYFKSKSSANEKGSNTFILWVISTGPSCPRMITLRSFPPFFSYSAITCLQEPHGVIGSLIGVFSLIAVMARATGALSGYFELAKNKATLSAHNPDG